MLNKNTPPTSDAEYIKQESFFPFSLIEGLVLLLVLAGLHLIQARNYLLFHSLVEIFSVIVACSVFLLALNARRFMRNDYLVFVGAGYFCVALIDLLHTLAYKGMNVFSDTGANLATEFWIAARYLEALVLLISPVFIDKRVRSRWIFLIMGLVTALLIASITYWNIFPDSYDEEVESITLFKYVSEYVISLILIGAIVFLYFRGRGIDMAVRKMVMWAIALTIAAELAFTLYQDVYGILNAIGHYLKLISFYLVYKAVIVKGLQNPYALLFKQLTDKNTELERNLNEIRTLRGLLPICSHCKKIRDDGGYWKQLEVYLHEHSEAQFSHSLCPDCVEKLYSDLENGRDEEE
ncbi:MAG: MASE3 domain-containing protein [Candidatus Sumerlaeia bacterium]